MEKQGLLGVFLALLFASIVIAAKVLTCLIKTPGS